jgi:hypothetical protein
VQRLFSLHEHRSVVPPSRLSGLDREQDAPLGIDGEVPLRGRRQLTGRRETRVVSRLAAQDERECCERGSRRCKQREPGERRPPPPRTPPCQAIRRGPGLGEERALARGEGEVGRSRPGFELRQAPLARQVLWIPAGVVPLRDCVDEAPVEEQGVATLSDPVPKPLPLGQDRLVGDLDGRRPCQRLAVEGKQAMLAVACEHLVERIGLELELAELAATNPAPRVVRGGVGAHEAEEDLAAGCPRRRTEMRVKTLGTPAERADDPARRDVALERQHVGGAVREQLGERVLQERHGTRLVAHVGDDLGNEPWLEANADTSRRPLDRLGKLFLRRRRNRDHPGPQQLPELRVAKGVIEEVGAQRHENTRGRVGVVGQRSETCEEPAACLLVGREREQLLELVDHEQQLAPGREDPLHDATDPELVPRELLDEIVRSLDCDPEERGGELLVRIRAGEHVGDERWGGSRQRAAAERRDEPGPDDGGLSDPGRAHYRDQATVAYRLHELVDERCPAVEVGSVRLVERPQALVRVLRGRVGLSRLDGLPRGDKERGEEAVDRLVALLGTRRGCACDHFIERGRQLRPERAQRRERPIHRRPLGGEQLERQQSEAVEVRLRCERPTGDRLGRDVRRRRRDGAARVL